MAHCLLKRSGRPTVFAPTDEKERFNAEISIDNLRGMCDGGVNRVSSGSRISASLG